MSTLIDTNVLLRRLDPAHDHHHAAIAAAQQVLAGGAPAHVAAQSVAEFCAVATRPRSANGLGLDVAAALAAVGQIERTFQLLPDDPAVYDEWKKLVAQHRVVGLRVFDARLVAVMRVHEIARILTFNTGDFAGYDGIEVLDPAGVE